MENKHHLPKKFVNMIVYCKDCQYRGFKRSLFCTYEDRFISTGEHFKTKKDKNLKGNCRDYQPLWWKFWLTGNRPDRPAGA